MSPIYTAFYTRGTLYEAEAKRLAKSLDRLGLEHDIQPVDSLGDWVANTKQTAAHICRMLTKYPDRPVVQLDADAVVWRLPSLFDELPSRGVDVAVHYRQGRELLNGTVWFNATPEAKFVAHRYFRLIRDHPGCANEQTMLSVALEELRSVVNAFRLPAGFTFIPDIMARDLAEGEQVVISHFQASRSAKKCGGDAEANRHKWITEWEKLQGELCI